MLGPFRVERNFHRTLIIPPLFVSKLLVANVEYTGNDSTFRVFFNATFDLVSFVFSFGRIFSFSVPDNGVAYNNPDGIENASTSSKIQKCQKCAYLLGCFRPWRHQGFRFWSISITILVISECCTMTFSF